MMRRVQHLAISAGFFLSLLAGPGGARAGAPQAVDSSASERVFCKAVAGYRFEFPRDHFAHPCYQTEWWYFTGNVSTSQGRSFGFQLTFFREGVKSVYPNPSRWRADDLYLAHFAISDLANQRFFYSQTMRRAGVGLAGVEQAEGHIWNGLWRAELKDGAWRLQAAQGDHAIELLLLPHKPPVIQGNNGISQKAEGEGNASHYYSLTRLETSGKLRIDNEVHAVSGWAWMDHEFSTSQLQPEQVGWDWVSLQMEDGTECMLFQLRRKDGSRDPHSAGSFVDREGRATQLHSGDFQMTPLAEWTSPTSGVRYPIRWRVQVPRIDLNAEVVAAMPDQELDARETTGTVYWEGSIRVTGQRHGRAVAGRGYLEMTGYAGPLPATLYSGPPR